MSEAGDPALMGRRVAGKFVVETFLGGGSMGAVYRARDEFLERKVALKVMHPSVAVDPSFVRRFHREARAASRLDHPSSMRVIEYGEEPDGLLYIAMEYLEGRDLYRVIHEDWPLPEERIADILMKALAAIAVAHEMGVIHRDLKPENIMILSRKDDEGRDAVKVCDFGIAKITEPDEDAPPGAPPKTAGGNLTTQGLVVGTPEYMSPEQARGEKLDFRSDLYSMGVMLYQLLTGRPPFLGDTALAVVLKHISEPPEPPHAIYPGVHKGLEAVCLRALAKSKEDRWASARDMRAAIKAAMGGHPASAPTPAAPAHASSGHQPVAEAHASAPRTKTDALPDAPPRPAAERGFPTVVSVARRAEGERRSRAPAFVLVAFVALAIGGFAYYRLAGGSWPDAPAPATSATSAVEPPTSTPSAATPPASGRPPRPHAPRAPRP
jgi:serine/threonine-protein kinase